MATGLIGNHSFYRKLAAGVSVSAIGATYALMLGDDEIRTGTYLLKHMYTGEQHPIEKNNLVSFILAHTGA